MGIVHGQEGSVMFKKIVASIATVTTPHDFEVVCDMIDDAFRQEMINPEDKEILYAVLDKMSVKE